MATTSTLVLPVPYEAQLDNASSSGWRECFSSSSAMVARFWNRTKSDDAYNVVRRRFGDTTDPLAQLAALRALGLDCSFRTDGTAATLETEIKARRPVAVGWLHRGPVSAPTGGGHWSVVVGMDPRRWLIHDPYGEPDLIGGGHLPDTSGRGVWVNRSNFGARWRPGGSGGWCVTCRGPVPF
jgi:hypothetical protein